MTVKFKKSAICLLMALIVCIVVALKAPVKAYAASPFWGAKYFNVGQTEIDIPINVTSSVTKYTVKTWDFSGSPSIAIDVYNPNNERVNYNTTIINGNGEIGAQVLIKGYVTGTYKIHCVINYGDAGGWVSTWIY